MEYKGPRDCLSVNSFYKVMGYGGILQSSTKKERLIPPEEITITLVGNHYPRKLIEFLKERYSVRITNPEPGIHYIDGLLFPIQILVQSQLDQAENIWLSRLRQNLTQEQDVETLAYAYYGKENDPLYSAAMDVIIRANWKVYKESEKMCDALNELFAEKLEKKRAEGEAKGKALSILELLEELGPVPASLREQILSWKDETQLSHMLKLAARSESLEEFMGKMAG